MNRTASIQSAQIRHHTRDSLQSLGPFAHAFSRSELVSPHLAPRPDKSKRGTGVYVM
jgi:hypothetical protein